MTQVGDNEHNGEQTPQFTPIWHREDESFQPLVFSLLARKGLTQNEYLVYENYDDEPKIVNADTVVKAIELSEIDKPVKVEHAHCRMPSLLYNGQLHFEQNVSVLIDEDNQQWQETNLGEDSAPTSAATEVAQEAVEPQPTPQETAPQEHQEPATEAPHAAEQAAAESTEPTEPQQPE